MHKLPEKLKASDNACYIEKSKICGEILTESRVLRQKYNQKLNISKARSHNGLKSRFYKSWAQYERALSVCCLIRVNLDVSYQISLASSICLFMAL